MDDFNFVDSPPPFSCRAFLSGRKTRRASVYLHAAMTGLLVLLITSCETVQPALHEISLPPKEIVQNGYSLMPPNEKGWLVGKRSADQLILGRRGDTQDETLVIQAMLIKLAPFNSNEEFTRQIKEEQAKKIAPGRFRILVHDVLPYPEHGTYCVRSHTVVEDHGATKQPDAAGYMILEALTLTCAHPDNSQLGIDASYSQRYFPAQDNHQFFERAANFLQTVEFTRL